MKRKVLLITILILLMIYALIRIYITFIVPTNKYRIIKKFKDNKELFEEVVEKLSNEEEIFFRKEYDVIFCYISKTVDDKSELVKLEQEDVYKYGKTTKLIENLDLISIRKIGANIEFVFHTSFGSGGKAITYVADENYLSKTFIIDEAYPVFDNWYYTVTYSL